MSLARIFCLMPSGYPDGVAQPSPISRRWNSRCGLFMGMRFLLLPKNGQAPDIVAVAQRAAAHGILELELETRRRADAALDRQRAAEHQRALGEIRTGAGDEIGWRQHLG